MSDAVPVRKEWTITLDPPIDSAGMTCSELKLRPPTSGEMVRALAVLSTGNAIESRANMQATLVHIVSGVPRNVVDAMPYYVVEGAARWLEGFTAISPPTTPT